MARRRDDALPAEVAHLVVDTMLADLAAPLTIDDLARTARLSRFHFARVFKTATGVSPSRFRYAVRLHAAKRYLAATSLSVVDVSQRVGYASVGTFSTRFTRSVGLPPTRYRELGPLAPLRWFGHTDAGRPGRATVHGRISGPWRGQVFVGLFPEPIAEGAPARGAAVGPDGSFVLSEVPAGRWFLLAYSPAAAVAEFSADEQSIGSVGPIAVPAGPTVTEMVVEPRPLCPLDPPLLFVPFGLAVPA